MIANVVNKLTVRFKLEYMSQNFLQKDFRRVEAFLKYYQNNLRTSDYKWKEKKKKPLQSVQIGVSSTDIFSLKVLKLGIDIEPITSLHFKPNKHKIKIKPKSSTMKNIPNLQESQLIHEKSLPFFHFFFPIEKQIEFWDNLDFAA